MAFWNRLKPDGYAKGLKHSTLGNVAVPVIIENSKGRDHTLISVRAAVRSACRSLKQVKE